MDLQISSGERVGRALFKSDISVLILGQIIALLNQNKGLNKKAVKYKQICKTDKGRFFDIKISDGRNYI